MVDLNMQTSSPRGRHVGLFATHVVAYVTHSVQEREGSCCRVVWSVAAGVAAVAAAAVAGAGAAAGGVAISGAFTATTKVVAVLSSERRCFLLLGVLWNCLVATPQCLTLVHLSQQFG